MPRSKASKPNDATPSSGFENERLPFEQVLRKLGEHKASA